MMTLGGDPQPRSARAGAEVLAMRKQGNRKRKPGKASPGSEAQSPDELGPDPKS